MKDVCRRTPSRYASSARTTAVLAIAALIDGVRFAAGTTTIGPTTVTAHFQSDAKALIALVALGIAGRASWGRARAARG